MLAKRALCFIYETPQKDFLIVKRRGMSSHSRTRRILATLSAIAFAFVPSTLANAAENKPAIPKVQYQIERSDGDDLGITFR